VLVRSILLAAASLMWPATVVAQSAGAPLVLEAKIPLGQVSGRIDHLGIDLKRQRLFVVELGNNSLGVVDLAAGKVLRTVTGLSEPQGVAYRLGWRRPTLGPPSTVSSVRQLLPVVSGASASPIPFTVLM
jgi:YVTN family beta-propeller protein